MCLPNFLVAAHACVDLVVGQQANAVNEHEAWWAWGGFTAFGSMSETGTEKQVACLGVCGRCVSTFCFDFSWGNHLSGSQGWVYYRRALLEAEIMTSVSTSEVLLVAFVSAFNSVWPWLFLKTLHWH